jgi:hypothetical protein
MIPEVLSAKLMFDTVGGGGTGGGVEIGRWHGFWRQQRREFGELRFIQLDLMKHLPYSRVSYMDFSTGVSWSFWIGVLCWLLGYGVVG